MHVLITRPEDDGEKLRARVEALGWRATLAPLIRIEPCDIPANALDGAEAVTATSRNSLRSLARSPALFRALRLPVYVVGTASATLAAELGFRDIREGAGTAADLVPMLRDAAAGSHRIAYLAGDHTAFDLEAALASTGLELLPIQAYRSVAAETLPPEASRAMIRGAIDAVILMSPRTASVWAALAMAAKPPWELARVCHVCFSQAVADALPAGLNAKPMLVAERPRLEDLLELLKRLAARSKPE